MRRAKRRQPLERGHDGAEGPVFDRPDTSEVDPHPGEDLEHQEVASLVWEAASALNPREYTLLDMHIRQELSAAAIASVPGIRSGALYTKLGRLRTAVEEAVVSKLLMQSGRDDCPDLTAIVAAQASDEFNRKTRKAIQKHLETCPACQENKRRVASPMALFGARAPVAALPGVKDTTWASVSGQMSAPGGSGSVSSSASQRIGDWWLVSGLFERLIPFVLAAVIASLMIGAAAASGGSGSPPAQDPTDAHSTSHETGTPSANPFIQIAWSPPEEAEGFSVSWAQSPEGLPDETTDPDR